MGFHVSFGCRFARFKAFKVWNRPLMNMTDTMKAGKDGRNPRQEGT